MFIDRISPAHYHNLIALITDYVQERKRIQRQQRAWDTETAIIASQDAVTSYRESYAYAAWLCQEYAQTLKAEYPELTEIDVFVAACNRAYALEAEYE